MTNGNESEGRLDRIEMNLERVTARLDRLAEQDERRFEAFDLRLDRLEERHEALTQIVELIASMQRENEVRQQKTETLMAQALEAINALARIAQAHERRLDGLEKQQ